MSVSRDKYNNLIVEQEGKTATYPAACYFEYREGALFIYDDSPGCIAIYHANQWIKAYYTNG